MVALAEKHQNDGPSQPLSLVIMQTPKGMQASSDELALRGRAIQLVETIPPETNMEEGLRDVKIDDEIVSILRGQGFETVITLPEGEIVIAYHSLIQRTAGAECWTLARNLKEHNVVPFLPHLLEVTQMAMTAELVNNGEACDNEEKLLRDDIAQHIEEPENWAEISILQFFNSALPKMSQVRGLKSQPIVQVMSMREPKLKWRDASDNDEIRGDEVYVSGAKCYVRRDTDIRVLYEMRPDAMSGMRLGQLAADYRLLEKGHRDTELIM